MREWGCESGCVGANEWEWVCGCEGEREWVRGCEYVGEDPQERECECECVREPEQGSWCGWCQEKQKIPRELGKQQHSLSRCGKASLRNDRKRNRAQPDQQRDCSGAACA